jgi:hypothetical protein
VQLQKQQLQQLYGAQNRYFFGNNTPQYPTIASYPQVLPQNPQQEQTPPQQPQQQ